MPTFDKAVNRPDAHFSLRLPDSPPDLSGPVKAWRQDVEILTYHPEKPEVNPMFLEKRVYQGSSGRVYPLPFIDRIAEKPEKKMWKAIHIENEILRLMILPEIGGRIHVGYDKRTGYNFFYRQNVIKPALVGLAGPWISGGVEFNWPQHHRPATFMPVETEIERAGDGSVTVWCSDHDPLLRMKGMHGVCLRPGQAVLDLRVRLFNRTQFTQTFLWWANVAARVHEKYQSFFPPDVRFVADHAKRAITSFPLSDGIYYGVDYGERSKRGVPEEEKPRRFVPDGSYPANDLSWYANIPVPTSYMAAGSERDFFGGFDHNAQAGVVHVANHHIAPGKKQWTWGNHDFGYAWDRSLTEQDGPYIELMAGVYTDNQPDFSFLGPWETKSFTQSWYPIHGIGVPVAANLDAAISLAVGRGEAVVGVYLTREVGQATVVLKRADEGIARWSAVAGMGEPLLFKAQLPCEGVEPELQVIVTAEGRTLIEFDSAQPAPAQPAKVAKEPAAPEDMETVEELYLTGLHLEQYRHATRRPEIYWQEGLRRDPGESRLHNALGLWLLRRGEFEAAARHFEAAIARATSLNPNPRDSEAYYNLGIARRYQGRGKEAYDALYKSTWSAAWRGPAYFAIAEYDADRADWHMAYEHVQRSLRAEADNMNARNLLSLILERLGDHAGSRLVDAETLGTDSLDAGARWRRGVEPADGQSVLDLAFDFLRAGQYEDALRVLDGADLRAGDGSAPMILFTTAYIQAKLNLPASRETAERAEATLLDYCFPSRLEELVVLEWVTSAYQHGWAAHYLLGNLLYDKRRHEEAIDHWEMAAARGPAHAVVQRNLGIAYFNVHHDSAAALDRFDRAFTIAPRSSRIFYERDQLWKRAGRSPKERLKEFLGHPDLASQRDDLSVELAALYNQADSPDDALHLLLERNFQPWEGGEGLVLAQYARACLLLGRRSLAKGECGDALAHFQAALTPPENLGEAWHLLANRSEIYYWIGEAFIQQEQPQEAKEWWTRAAQQIQDFKQMAVREVSSMTYWSALAFERLNRRNEASALFEKIHAYSFELENAEPKIDYFATSLPAMLLFDDNLSQRNRAEAYFLRAQACAGLGRSAEARALLGQTLQIEANHAAAADLLCQLKAPAETRLQKK